MVGGKVGSAERWREAMERAIGSGSKTLDRLLESVDEGKEKEFMRALIES